MGIRTAEEFITEHDYGNGKLDKKGTIEAMQSYAKQFINLALLNTNYKHNPNVSTISIKELKDIKQLIK